MSVRLPSITRLAAWQYTLVAGLAVVFAVQLVAGSSGGPAWLLVQAAGVVVTVTAVLRRDVGAPLGWWLLAAAQIAAIAVNGWWMLQGALGAPAPGNAPLGMSLTVVWGLYAAAGYVVTRKPRRGRSATESGAEFGTVVLFLAMLAWSTVIVPYLDAPGYRQVDDAMAAFYAGLDIAILIVVLRGLNCSRLVSAAGVTLLAPHLVYAAVGGSGTGPFLPGGFGFLAIGVWSVLVSAAVLHPNAGWQGTCQVTGDKLIGRPRLIGLVAMAVASPLLPVAGGYLTGSGSTAAVIVPAAITAVLCGLLLARIAILLRLGEGRAAQLAAALAEQQELQQRLAYRAGHDALTGIANRDLLMERLTATAAGDRPYALLLCGLDGFKAVNDTYGHPVGDTVLRQLAGRLSRFAPEVDLVARLGGDEFALLAEDPERTDDLAARVLAAVADAPFVAGERRIHLTMSAGAAIGVPTSGPAATLGDGDLALRAAKQAGGARLSWFDDSLRAEQSERARIAAGLRQALAEGTLLMHYQPVVDTATGRTLGVEALMRWRRDGETIPPGVFIPVAEQTGLIVALGIRALRLACAQAARWHAEYGLYVTVNVSTHQLRDPGFAGDVRTILAETGLPARALVLEITESVLIDATDTGVLDALRAGGIRIAIDDFGTGYSSLAYLHQLPVDILKIDQSFISRLQDPPRPQDVSLTRAILELAGSQDLIAVAEGVETAAQAVLLRELHCPLSQGYHFGRPMEPEMIEARMREANPAPVR
ncbi:putative bifunctional diguanylate cyclase/phosphodiesterase [Actinoplanes sp. CA-015351]|uniref:putative bifunctional diguanylate cyclase/phosphodiesterase n=1 Tax=Actinoplanes sp. CA-015351 TaxID=3239897 RepID=UPI003D952994